MRLNPTHPNNYNGFIHPDYLEHLKPHIERMPASIAGMDIVSSNALKWAEKGILEDLSIHRAATSFEAMIAKGMKAELVQFIEAEEPESNMMFLKEYYFGDSAKGLSFLLTVLNDPIMLMTDLESLSVICIQDLGFNDSAELESFLTANLNPSDRLNLRVRLGYLLDHFRTDPEDIRKLDASAKNSYDWIKSATCWANTGDLDACRISLENAEALACEDFQIWQIISRKYLHLLGDFDKFNWILGPQMIRCTDSFDFLQLAEDLRCYVGDERATSMAMEMMHFAELAATDSHDLIQVADAWEKYFDADPDHVFRCRKVAELHSKFAND